jgi:hypothetical protein
VWAGNPTTRSSCLQTRWTLGGGIGHVGQGGTREVGQLQVLEAGPQVLDRVQLGRVGGEPLVLLRS